MNDLNEMQQQAVEHVNGPLLILAGAGSGKTRVITYRAAYLINQCGVAPRNILAITFTNKAANEMRERICKEVGHGGDAVWAATFHSTCVRILRRFIDRLPYGYTKNFTIYDSDDQKRLMKQVLKNLQLDPKLYKDRTMLNAISSAKDELVSPIEYKDKASGNYGMGVEARVYSAYQEELRKNNALDFDDLIVKTVELFQDHADVLSYYQDKFRYIMVDEYQDTNTAQFELIRLLAKKNRNLCVVGDDDQSIYKFRGANIHNILDFEKVYPDAMVIRLEENYRSTGNILDAANAVISNNLSRKGKTLWTRNEEGEKVSFHRLDNAYEEARYISDSIRRAVKFEGASYQDHAVLYRTNAQSRILEEQFVLSGIPYKIVGGVNFYARKEIKDLVCYLQALENPSDDLSIQRILNVPKRGIGNTTVERLQAYAAENGISFFDAMKKAKEIPSLKRSAGKIQNFTSFLEEMQEKKDEVPVSQLLQEIIDQTGYVRLLEAEHTDESAARVENIDELVNKVVSYEQDAQEPTLAGFLQEVSLVADIDNYSEDQDYVVLMTLHSAKGLEFDHVFLAGMEDGLFPGFLSILSGDASEMEEERRLCYVGITRARKKLDLTSAAQRMTHGEIKFNPVSRFVKEIPRELLDGDDPGSEGTGEMSSGFSFGEGRDSGSSFGGRASGGGSSYGSTSRGGFSGSGSSYGSSLRGGFSGSGSSYGGFDTSASRGSTSSQAGSRSGSSRGTSYGSPYGKGKRSPSKPSSYQVKEIKKGRLEDLGYSVGDRVSHVKFGKGVVKDIKDGGRDFEVTVEFDRFGVKKMFAGFAKLKAI